jgi:hypothetical protein
MNARVLPLRVSWALQVIVNAFDARRPAVRSERQTRISSFFR